MPASSLLRRFAAPALLLVLAACGSPSTADPDPEPQPQPQPQPTVSAEAKWLAANAHPLRAVSLTDYDFSDLQPLKAAIGNARVVMLGEQSHGDGTTFLAKARLVAFLHREMGFDVLAWESGIWDVGQVWRQVQAGSAVLQASRGGIFAIWTGSEQVLPTLDYVANTVDSPRPLELAGFDTQLTGQLARDSLRLLTDQFARHIESRVVQDPAWPDALAALHYLSNPSNPGSPPADQRQNMLRLLAELRTDALARGTGDRDAAFWAQVLESLAAYTEVSWPTGGSSTNNLRDAQMARNLVWLANTRYAGRKIIVWAATVHTARNVAHLTNALGQRHYESTSFVPMGGEVYKALGPQMYAIGFTAAAGQYGAYWNTPQTMTAPRPGSLEAYFVESGHTNAFLDLRALPAGGEWLRSIYARPFGYADFQGDWTSVLDAMIFTHNMAPSTTASR